MKNNYSIYLKHHALWKIITVCTWNITYNEKWWQYIPETACTMTLNYRTYLLCPMHTSVTEILFVGCLMSQQHASVSQGRICSDNFTCCHTEIEVANQTFHLTQSQYTDTGPTSPSTDPITPGRVANWDSNPGSSALEADALPLGQRGGQ